MRQPKDIRECIHFWAHQVRESAKCGNVSYDGPVLYSYAQPIAILIDNERVLISNKHWSITTSSHQSLARQATYHMQHIHAPYLPNYGTLIPHNANRDYWMSQAERAVAELKNHPRRKKSVGDKIAAAVSSYNAYREFFAHDWPELTSDHMRELVEERAVERAAEEKRREEHYAAQRRQAVLDQAEKLELWRRNELNNYHYFEKMALRLSADGQEIETTRGARVPVDCAQGLWVIATSCRERNHRSVFRERALKIGNYQLNWVDGDGTLHIGCHVIPYDELVLMAKKLNFIQENSNGVESDRNDNVEHACIGGSQASAGEHHPAY